jgi:hypothetical protein
VIGYDAANATRSIGLRFDSLDPKKRRATFLVVVGRKGELAPAPQRFRLALAELPARTDILGTEIEVVAFGGDGVDLRVVKPLPPDCSRCACGRLRCNRCQASVTPNYGASGGGSRRARRHRWHGRLRLSDFFTLLGAALSPT